MGKRLPEELEAPDLKLARERKEQRILEARKKVIDESEIVPPEPVRFYDSESKEEPKKEIQEEPEKEPEEESEKEIQEEPEEKKDYKKRGRPPLKKWRR